MLEILALAPTGVQNRPEPKSPLTPTISASVIIIFMTLIFSLAIGLRNVGLTKKVRHNPLCYILNYSICLSPGLFPQF